MKIRDPSDGSVREKPVIDTGTTGLAITKERKDELKRLEMSHEWLREYQEKHKERHHIVPPIPQAKPV